MRLTTLYWLVSAEYQLAIYTSSKFWESLANVIGTRLNLLLPWILFITKCAPGGIEIK